MSDVPRRSVARGSVPRGRWLLVAALLTPAVVLPLWVPLYDRADPAFLGFPFYYWFQFLLVVAAVTLTVPATHVAPTAARAVRRPDLRAPAGVTLTVPAYLVATSADRAHRVAHGLPPEPDGTGASRDGEPR